MTVVDTHIIIWDALRPEMLSKKAQKAISEANDADGIILCDISLWEIAMLIKRKRLIIGVDYLDFIKLLMDANKYILWNISPEIADLSTRLFTDTNKDPADRIIAATAIVENAKLVTADKKLRKSTKVPTIW